MDLSEDWDIIAGIIGGVCGIAVAALERHLFFGVTSVAVVLLSADLLKHRIEVRNLRS